MLGFRDTDNPDYGSLLATLTATTSGQYYSDYHPLITFENLYSVAPNYDGFNYTAFALTSTYATGDFAKSANVAYEAIATVPTGQTPPNTTYWKLPINDWMTQKVEASINKVVNQVFVNKSLMQSTKTFIENVQLFDGAGRMQDSITPQSRFVGLRITPKKINNVAILLDYIGLQFTQTQTNLTFYLFHSSQYAPVATASFTTTTAYSFDWQAATSFGTLSYVDYSNNIDSGGDYFLGYFEDDISGSAIKKQHQFAGPPCGGCNDRDLNYYNLWSKYVEIQPIEVASGNLNGTNIWDLGTTGYPMASNFGINLSLSAKFDITDLLISNKTLFVDALGFQFAADMLQEFIYNPNSRLNQKGDNAQKQSVNVELNAEGGLRDQLKDQIKAVGFDLSKISQALPKDTPKRLRYGAK